MKKEYSDDVKNYLVKFYDFIVMHKLPQAEKSRASSLRVAMFSYEGLQKETDKFVDKYLAEWDEIKELSRKMPRYSILVEYSSTNAKGEEVTWVEKKKIWGYPSKEALSLQKYIIGKGKVIGKKAIEKL